MTFLGGSLLDTPHTVRMAREVYGIGDPDDDQMSLL
jgi:hypothetical protein